jgi:hypothetical protein
MRAFCKPMIVQKSMGNFMQPVSSWTVTFPLLISSSYFGNVSADGSCSILTLMFNFSWTFSTLHHSGDDFKKALIKKSTLSRHHDVVNGFFLFMSQ